MQRIFYQPTDRSPLVDFDFPNHHLTMEGESYPEDAAAFFGPLLEALEAYLDQLDDSAEVVFDFRMSYFNSSSAKSLMNMFQLLESAAQAGRNVTINWYYLEDDDTMEEFGEDFSEDFTNVRFKLCPLPASGE